MKTKYGLRWSTFDEIKFIKGLGKWKFPAAESDSLIGNKKLNLGIRKRLFSETRKGLLFNYKASMLKRKNWGEIDPAKLLKCLPK